MHSRKLPREIGVGVLAVWPPTQITPIVCDAHITEERTLTTATQTWTERMAEAAGSTVQVVSGGTGAPLLILHEEMGHPGWMRYHEALAQSFEITIPSHPGFGDSPFIDWIMNMRDLAGWYLAALDDMGIEKTSLLGFSFGGWLAAEIATMEPDRFDKLVLVNPMGIKPPVGEIFDMFLVVAKEFITESFLDPASAAEFEDVCPDEPTPEQAERWEVAREQACRLGWRPYMYYAALPHLLGRLKKLPTRIIWGRENPIVPLSAGQVYHESRSRDRTSPSSTAAATAPRSSAPMSSSASSGGFWRTKPMPDRLGFNQNTVDHRRLRCS